MTYESQIRMYIVLNLGDVPLVLFVREASQRLETLYSRLRKCRRSLCKRPSLRREARGRGPARLHRRRLRAACLQALRRVQRAFNLTRDLSERAAPRCGGAGSRSTRCRRSGCRRRCPRRVRRRARRWPASEGLGGVAEWGSTVWLSAVLGACRARSWRSSGRTSTSCRGRAPG
ncbi:hypothetical protein HBB16_05055 [Pseudonocardia sp. MCCB 268]|nr:hypothetical protein [Pseudonocardia cytotoxica]